MLTDASFAKLNLNVVREIMKKRYLILAPLMCAAFCIADDSKLAAGLNGVVSATSAVLGLNGTLRASVTISNAGPGTIMVDTTPDEIIQPKTERSGAVTVDRGSRLTLKLYQDHSKGFRVEMMKIGFRSPNPRLVLKPGDSHTEELSIDLSSTYLPSFALQEGPARLMATLHLVIDGKMIDLPCREFYLVLKKEDIIRTTKGSRATSGSAPSAAPESPEP